MVDLDQFHDELDATQSAELLPPPQTMREGDRFDSDIVKPGRILMAL